LDKLLVALTSQIRSTSLKEGAIDEHLIRLIHAYGTSDDQIHRLDVCQQLTRELWVRWNDHTDELALEGCVEMGRELLELLPGHTELNKHLANCLYTLSKRTGAVALIEEAIRLERVVLALYPTGHANRASSCASLAASLFVHFDHTGDTSSLEESIQLEREALSLLKTDHPDYSASSVSLAAALHARFELTGIASLLDEAIQLARDLLSLYPDHPRREIMCTNLATFLQSQFDRTGGSKIIEEVIRMRREVLTLRPIGDPNRAYACGYLGIALHAQFEITGNTALLDEAKQLHEEELSLRSVDHPKLRAETCAHFAALLRARFYTTGNMEELERAVQLNREALSLCPVGRPDRGRFCGSLAASLTVYIEHVAVDTSFLVEATALAREAVALFPSTSSSYPDACRNLANLEYYSYLQTGDFDALEEAIRLQREATSMCAWDHPDRAYSCSRLARLLLAYFEHTGGMAWCDEAIQLTREALSLEPAQVPSHAVRCTDLSESLLKRYQQTLDESVLHEAIQLQRRALAQPSTAHRNHTTMRANLARSLLYEHDCTGNMAALDEEIELRREVLEARPPGHPDRAVSALNLAMSLYRHARLRRNTDELKEATEWNRHTLALLPAGHPQRAMACCCLAEELHRMSTASIGHASLLREESRDLWNESLSSRPPGHPDRWESMLGIAEIASYYQDHTAVIDSLSDAMGSPPYDGIPAFVSSVVTLLTLVDISVIDQARRQVMLQLCSNALGLVVLVADLALDHAAQLPHTRKGSSLGPLAFHIGVLAENLPGGLAVLERARGIIWSLTLQLRNPQLDRVPADLAAKLSMLIPGTSADTISEVPGTSFLPERDLQYEHRSRRQQVLRDIRSLPGLGDFMRGPDVSALLAAAARNPVVILVAGKAECHALIIASPQEPLVALAIPELHATALQNLRFGPNMPSQRGSTADSDQRLGIKVSKLASHTAMMLEKLWKLVVRPVLARLGFKVSRVGSTLSPVEALTAGHRNVIVRPSLASTGA
jgi:tetratricopeptide (TPR) repeat protein